MIQEYHQRLVVDVVTGKLDVRDLEVHDVEVEAFKADLEEPEDLDPAAADA